MPVFVSIHRIEWLWSVTPWNWCLIFEIQNVSEPLNLETDSLL